MSVSLADAFKGRRVFITGHTGFKGSWLTIWLHRLGAEVFGYSLPPPTEPSNFKLSRVAELLRRGDQADVRDASCLTAALTACRPDVVFHLAAQSLVREGYARPRDTFEVNVLGTVNLLEAVRAYGRPCAVVVVTSDKCYVGEPPQGGFTEDHALGGHDPYSASKAAAEMVVAAYRRSYFSPELLAEHGVSIASARAGNVIAGGDWSNDRIIPDTVRSLSTNRPVSVRNPHAIRPWQHVLEPLGGYLQLAARMLTEPQAGWCEPWNFGPPPGADIPVSSLVEQFITTWGGGRWQHETPGPAATDSASKRTTPAAPPGATAAAPPAAPAGATPLAASPTPLPLREGPGEGKDVWERETPILRLAIQKATAKLSWHPRWPLAEAIRRTAAWYRRYYSQPGAETRSACLDDIAAYETAGKSGA